MPRNVFLSFLGITSYEPVRYYLEETGQSAHYRVEKYVQKTLLDHLATTFSPTDVAYVFITDQARENNWTAAEGQIRLKAQVEAAYSFSVHGEPVKDESNTEAIWDTFQTMYDLLEEGDTVFLDITHSWRYLPMLGATLLNYAKALKSVQVGAIYYGALERLAPLPKVKEIPEEERWTPILNLISFSELQDWATAARDFVSYGNPNRWNALASKTIDPIMKATSGRDTVMHNLRGINKKIQELVPLISTNRGGALQQFPFDRLSDMLNVFSAGQSFIKPLNPIIDLVSRKVAPFMEAGSLKWLEAVKWCIDHQLTQQGITQLQEGLLTWLCDYFKHLNIAPDFFDWQKEEPRNLLSSALNFLPDPPPESDWNGAIGQFKQTGKQVMQFPLVKKLAPLYQGLGQIRNDINHGGYPGKVKAADFAQALGKYYREIRQLLLPELAILEKQARGLLNLSNHPSANWSAEQLKVAREQYGPVEDMPFPAIDPAWTEDRVAQLAEQYFEDILHRLPVAVHLMGEMTFTVALLHKLQSAGIPCVASTSERQVIDHGDGRKEAQFRFVRFRPYY